MMLLIRYFPLLAVLWLSPVHADTFSLPLGQLFQAGHDRAALERLDAEVREALATSLGDRHGWLDSGAVVLSYHAESLPLDGGCEYASEIEVIDLQMRASDASQFSLQLDSLREPGRFVADVPLLVEARGSVQQRIGKRVFGRCYPLGKDSFSFTVTGQGRLVLTTELNPHLTVTATELTFTPTVDVSAELLAPSYHVTVDGTWFENLTAEQIEKGIARELRPEVISAHTAALEEQLGAALSAALGNEPLRIPLANLDASQRVLLDQMLQTELLGPLGKQYLRDNLPSLLYALVADDTGPLKELVGAVAACELLASEQRELALDTTYQRVAGVCQAATAESLMQPATLFSDPQCSNRFAFSPTSWVDYCSVSFDSRRLGNGALEQHPAGSWTLSPGTTLALGVQPIEQNHQPFMTRAVYKQSTGPAGQCDLEMRIYKKAVDASALKPLLALHGGSWNSRVFGFVGLESMISHYTESGFVVFVPFYRLTGTQEGTQACHGVTGAEITADVQDALNWVTTQAGTYGASGPVSLIGQSAGAQLALALAYHNPGTIDKALLMYPPTDFGRLIEQLQSEALSERQRQGQQALADYLGRPIETVSLYDTDVQANSFPALIDPSPLQLPPVFLIHGAADQTVPVDQSERLCRALAGDLSNTPPLLPTSRTDLKQTYQCGPQDARLHVIAQGDHALDACVFSLFCPAGNVSSRQAVVTSLQEAQAWLLASNTASNKEQQRILSDNVTQTVATGSTGGGILSVWMLLGLTGLYRKAGRWSGVARQIQGDS